VDRVVHHAVILDMTEWRVSGQQARQEQLEKSLLWLLKSLLRPLPIIVACQQSGWLSLPHGVVVVCDLAGLFFGGVCR